MGSQWYGSFGKSLLQSATLVAATLASVSGASAQVPMATEAPPGQVTPFPVQPTLLPACPAEEEKDPFSVSLTLNQDNFFGFYPILNGSYNIDDNWAFTFYGQLWTTPSFSVGGTGGFGLWTEAGIGLSYTILDGTTTINPQIGVLNGVLLSGADRAQAFEGLVPTLTINHNSDYLQGQFYAAYYLATAAPSNNDFVHWWVNGGVKPFADQDNWTKIFSVGAHIEQLYQTKNKNGTTSNLYTWIGPYVQFQLPNNAFMRFTTGVDTADNFASSFYKLTLGLSF